MDANDDLDGCVSPALERYRQDVRDAEAGGYCVSCKRPFGTEQSKDEHPEGCECGGFDRNGSHSEGRYVGYCAGPQPTIQANDEGAWELTVYYDDRAPFDVYGPFPSSDDAMAFGERLKAKNPDLIRGYGTAALKKPEIA